MRTSLLYATIILFLFLPGCSKRQVPITDEGMATVTVAKPIEREVTDYADFTGRTDAIFSTDIRPRVTGFLVGMPFKEGAVVRQNDILFEIDDRPYKASLDQAQGDVERQKGAFVKAQANLDIGLNVQKENPRAISVQEINSRLGSRDEAAGALKVAQANEVMAQLNYDWCKVRSPIEGHVSRYDFTLGNLVNADATLLTTVVSESPIYVYFDVDENTMLYVLRNIVLPSNEDVMAQKGRIPVIMGLADEQGYPHPGDINFANNVVNSSTGTITLRGEFDNPANPAGKRLLRPGMFVRVRLPLGKQHQAILVNEKALGTDQGQKYLLVVNPKNVVDYRRVTVGPLQDDGMRVIEKGLQPGESVIISGLQMVRPGAEVKTETGQMEETASKDQEPHKS
jgi:membrane fusion protein, multidrug efflux system